MVATKQKLSMKYYQQITNHVNLKFILFGISYCCLIYLSGQEKLRVEYEVSPYYEPVKKKEINVTMISSAFELISDKNESLYSFIPKINNTQTEISGNISASMSANANPVYKNTKTKTYTEEAPFAEKTFLIKDELPEIDWQITKETKEIAGFPVQKATVILTDQYKTQVEAWYSPKLNYKDGPDKFWGLPGIILEITTRIEHSNGDVEGTKYLATKVEVLNSNEKLKIPSKGKEITQQEFNDMANEFMKNQMEMYGGGVDKD